MCDYESDGAPGTRIDQRLYEAARRIEKSLPGQPASDGAWQLFFGRAGGVLIWPDYQRVRQCYLKAKTVAGLSTSVGRPSILVCEQVQSAGLEGHIAET